MQKLFTLSILSFMMLAASCTGQSADASKTAKGIQNLMKTSTPGSVATTDNGFKMTAKIDGNDWAATEMMPPERAGRILGSINADYISMPFDRRSMVVGNKIKLGDGHGSVDIFMKDNLWSAKTGEMEITKVDEKSAGGKFYFTAGGFNSDKKMECTEGFFRILFK